MTNTTRPEATFDRDGYPTEEALDAILTFEGTAAEFVFFTQRLYRNGAVEIEAVTDDLGRDAFRIRYVTLGWSGCESVMSAIKYTLFMHFWRKSEAGGLDVFEVHRDQWNTNPGFWGDFRRKDGASPAEGAELDHRVELAHARKRALLLAANLIEDAVQAGDDVPTATGAVRAKAYDEIIAFSERVDLPATDLADDLTSRFDALCRLLEAEGHLTPLGTRQIKATLADSIDKH
ncbi:hypothetical protein GCM10025867_49630 (plasmid) [Frondihabitans sucicola]|uniref:Uncharacterized protein n=1 Tax=Frondihabitans sucicola TaxID=1268041 RepID=A0ABM8GW67_9MICO|nr:hypothetical protein [Frondihabitans sucicola]BDZ52722.1 hypothetical protein GCM10025867_49630 [Frondihabitans sucicola]